MYDDPNFNVIILSPGRTGSTLIFKFFSHVTRLTPYTRQHFDNKTVIKPKQILHSHNIDDIKLGNKSTYYVISKRNIIETAFSGLVGQHTKKWEYYKNHKTTISNFTVSKQDFLSLYQLVYSFYKDLSCVIPIKSHIVDYVEFKDNFENLFDIFNINKNHYKFINKNLIPIKTPGSYKDWILNYDEIYDYAITLDPNPPI
jgi:hypothetical protein